MSGPALSPFSFLRITRPRTFVYRVGIGLIGSCILFLLWSLTYLAVATARYNPQRFPSEGVSRWTLLEMQSEGRGWGSLFIAWNHFYVRLFFQPTQSEAIIRALIALGIVLALGISLAIFLYATRKPTHLGDARLGTIMDAERAHLTESKGIALGKLGSVLLMSDHPAHVLVIGPTRSGKGVSFIVPNGFLWVGSSIWFDPKRENFEILARYRQSIGDKVFMWRPGEYESHRYNPLDVVRRDERMATDCSVIASFMIQLPSSGEEYWASSGRILLASFIGYVICSKKYQEQATLRTVIEIISTGKNLKSLLMTLVAEPGLDMFVVRGFNQFIGLEEKTRNSVMGNVINSVKDWNNDVVAYATETSDFDIRDLRRKPMAIFIGCSVAQIDVFRTLIRIFVQQVHDCLMECPPGKDEPLQVLVVLDEFRQLGRVDSIVSKLSISASYGFRMVVVLQDVSQLDEIYGRATRMTTVNHCQVKLFVRINDIETAEYVSQMLGNVTAEIRAPLTRPGEGIFSTRGNNIHYHQQPLRSAQQLRNAPVKKSIIMVTEGPSFEVDKLFYYRDKRFMELLRQTKGVRVLIPSYQREARDQAQAVVEAVGFENSSAKSAQSANPTSDVKPSIEPVAISEVDTDEVTTVTSLINASSGSVGPKTGANQTGEFTSSATAQRIFSIVKHKTSDSSDCFFQTDNVAASNIRDRILGIGTRFGDV